MSVAVITGSAGLIGSAAARFFAGLGLDVVGIDNDMRSHLFGKEASTLWQRKLLERALGRQVSPRGCRRPGRRGHRRDLRAVRP